VIGVGLLEFYLVVVEEFGWLVLSPHINNNVGGLPDCWITAADHLGVFVGAGEFAK
jgi:hypothetical protein